MPLIKSSSPKAFGENIRRERAAGRPEKQAVAIAYSQARAADKTKTHKSSHSSSTDAGDVAPHSHHREQASSAYHARVVSPTYTRPTATKMTRSQHQLNNAEDSDEKGHKL